MNNIVNNPSTKEDLTYDHVYNNLMNLKVPTTVNSADNKAYKSCDLRRKGRKLEGNRPVTYLRPPPRNAPTAKSTSQLLAAKAIIGMSGPNSRPPT